MSKSREEKEAQAQERLAQEQRAAGERQRAAGQAAEARVTAVGKPTAEETGRLERYRGKALTPGETLMTQAGPISQAVARRIQERVTTPGMDYDPSTTMATLGPELWRGLKQRGIAPPPGAEPGLAGQQYMKGALPYLARERETAISRDIERGRVYGAEARQEVGVYEELERILSEALRGREVAGVIGGAPYGIAGEEAYGAGMIGGAQTEAEYAAIRAGRQREKRAKEEEEIKELVGTLVSMGMGAAGGGGAGAAGAAGAGKSLPGGGVTTGQTLNYGGQTYPVTSPDPYSRALQYRAQRR